MEKYWKIGESGKNTMIFKNGGADVSKFWKQWTGGIQVELQKKILQEIYKHPEGHHGH